ncbi:hypothetical protein LshimejAT787_1402530 [Lyophyllum shimeji]|uniref:Uncharacterized protein n=1 Tax=Lyophyllum shimeji TaxID=47721 RepID=A0A9P3PZ31_LYOSH|nr:hypothetical protein LshimejAT787_1402530 [Lyophyllum shimeji]
MSARPRHSLTPWARRGRGSGKVATRSASWTRSERDSLALSRDTDLRASRGYSHIRAPHSHAPLALPRSFANPTSVLLLLLFLLALAYSILQACTQAVSVNFTMSQAPASTLDLAGFHFQSSHPTSRTFRSAPTLPENITSPPSTTRDGWKSTTPMLSDQVCQCSPFPYPQTATRARSRAERPVRVPHLNPSDGPTRTRLPLA